MNILFICQHFYFPEDGLGTRNFEFAKRWAQKGHNVTILTSTARLDKQTLASVSASGRWIKNFQVQKVKIAACAVAYRQQMHPLRRCLSFAVFAILSTMAALFSKKQDIIYASSTPLTVGLPALSTKWFRRIPFVFEVRDQWPESVIQVGILKNKLLIKILSRFERLIYKQAAAIIALSEPMAEDVRNVAPPDKTVYAIPNCCDLDVFHPDVDGSRIRKQYHWENKAVFLHAGAMGKINGLDFVLRAAEQLRAYERIHFVLLGKGNRKSLLQKQCQDLDLGNVTILPFIPKAKVPEYMAAADVIMAIIGNYPIIEKHASLNKFFDGLSAGKPILLNYSGWQRKLIEDNQAGRGSQLCELEGFIDNVLYFYNNVGKLKMYGKNSRNIAEKYFSRDDMAAKALEVIRASKKNK